MTSINTLKMGMVRSTSSVSSTYTSPLDLLITSKVSTKKLALILFYWLLVAVLLVQSKIPKLSALKY